MNILIIIFLGGGSGAISRYILINFINQFFSLTMPYGTIVVNLIGAFLIGSLYYFISSKILMNEQIKIFLITGFLGGFTTFSSFNLDFYNLIDSGRYSYAIIYAGISFIGTIILFYLGYSLIKIII